MKAPCLLAMFALVTTAAVAQNLTWAEMAQRPELWPTQCSAKAVMKFDGGVTVQVGQKLNVLQVMATEVQVTTLDGRTTFTAEPDETDSLAVAQAAYTKLTPKQRALTYDSLVRQKELWPTQVALVRGFDVGGGRSLRAGDQLTVMDFQPGKLVVKIEAMNRTIQVLPQATDVMALARKLVEDENATPRFVTVQKEAQQKQQAVVARQQALGPIMTELEGKLVSSVSGKPQPLDESSAPRYFVFFRGSSTCPITAQFAPSLIKYYQVMKPQHPEVEFVYVMTESVEDTSKFARQIGFNWRAITYESTGLTPRINQTIDGKLPQLIVMDRSGRVLINGIQNAAPNALKQLDALLKMPARQP